MSKALWLAMVAGLYIAKVNAVKAEEPGEAKETEEMLKTIIHLQCFEEMAHHLEAQPKVTSEQLRQESDHLPVCEQEKLHVALAEKEAQLRAANQERFKRLFGSAGLIIGLHPLEVTLGLKNSEYTGALEVGFGSEIGQLAFAISAGTEWRYAVLGQTATSGSSSWGWNIGLELANRLGDSRVSLGGALEIGGDISRAGPVGLKAHAILEVEIGEGCGAHLSLGTNLITASNYYWGASYTSFSEVAGGVGVECLIPFFK